MSQKCLNSNPCFIDNSESLARACEVVFEEISNFRNSNEMDQKNHHYLKFLMNFIYLMNNHDTPDLPNDKLNTCKNFIYENIDFGMKSVASALETAKSLSLIHKIYNTTFNTLVIKSIFKGSCLNFAECPEILMTINPILTQHISNEDYFMKLFKSGLFEFILTKILMKSHFFNYEKTLFELCFVCPKPIYFKNISIETFISCFVELINKYIISLNSQCEIITKFVATFISKVSDVSLGTIDLFFKLGGFDAYDSLVSLLPENTRPSYYSFFVVSSCEASLIDHLLKLYQNNPKNEHIYFDMMYQIIRIQPELLQKCKITLWFKMAHPKINKLLGFLTFLNTKSPLLVSLSLPYLFISLKHCSLKTDTANRILTMISKLITQNLLTYQNLNDSLFLEVFFLHTTSDAFLSIINNPDFYNICHSTYLLSTEQNCYFAKLCGMISQIEKSQFIGICSTFIKESPTVENMKTLFAAIDYQNDSSYIQILINAFLESKTSQNSFVLSGGVNWIFDSKMFNFESINSLNSSIHDNTFIDLVVELISHMVKYQGYEQLEDKILSLNKNHPIFKVSQDSMRKMVFGNRILVYSPIRIRSLFMYLDDKDQSIDPQNIVFLGEKFIDWNLTNSIYNIPFINLFGNRYITAKHHPLLFEHPLKLIQFCDQTLDHFSFYQMYMDDDVLTFQSASPAFSFWFKIKNPCLKLTQMFGCDESLMIFISSKKLQISYDEIEYSIDIDPSKWNLIFLGTVMNNYLTFSVNSKTIQLQTKKKVQAFNNFTFMNHTDSILFIGKAIRVFKSFPQSIHDLYEKGPSFCNKYDCSSILNLSINQEIPSNSFLVPYFGFPKHIASFQVVLKLIAKCETFSLFESFFNLLMAMHEINPILNWYEFISVIKKSQQKLNSNMFLKALKTQKPTITLLFELVFDSKLWHIYASDLLLSSILNHFPIHMWKNEIMLVTFIANATLVYSDECNVAQIICSYLQDIPNLTKYISSIIKIAPTLTHLNPTWSQIEFRESTNIQEILVLTISSVITTENCKFFKAYFPFSEIKSLFIVSSNSLCSLLFDFITEIVIHSESDEIYFEPDFIFLSKLSQLSHLKSVWNSAIKIKNYSVIISLIWSASLALIYFYSKNSTSINKVISEIGELTNNAITYCIENINNIFEDNLCVSFILNFIPFIFTYQSLFNNIQSIRDNSSQPIILTINQFPEVSDELWISKEKVLAKFNFPSSSSPVSYSSFLQQIISTILTNFDFPLPITFATSNEVINDWFAQSPILDFIMSIISICSIQNIDSLLYSMVSDDNNNPLLSTFVHSLLGRIPSNSIEKISHIIEYVSVLSALQLLNQNTIILMSDIFAVLKIVQSRYNEKEVACIASQINPILISLFNSLPYSHFKMAFSLLTVNMNLFSFIVKCSGSLYSWLFAFIVFSHNESELFSEFIKKFSLNYIPNENDSVIIKKILNKTIQMSVNSLKMIEKEWKESSNEFHTFAQQRKNRIPTEKQRIAQEINRISFDVNYFKYYTNVKHLMLAFFVCQNLKYFEIISSLFDERNEWKNLLKKTSKKICRFNPKFQIDSKHHWYNMKTPIKLQSVFNELATNNQNTKSETIKHFKKTIKFQYHFLSDTPVNLLDIFKDFYGAPNSFSNCIFRFDDIEIPSILFIYKNKILIQTYTKMLNDNEFYFIRDNDANNRDIFLQNVFCGNFGKSELYGSQILLTIQRNSIIYIKNYTKNHIEISTIFNGHFELIFFSPVSIKFTNPFPFPIPNKKEVFQQWQYRIISTNDMLSMLSFLTNKEINSLDKLNLVYDESFLMKNNVEKIDVSPPVPFIVTKSRIIQHNLFNESIQIHRNIYLIKDKAIVTKSICGSCRYYAIEIDANKYTLLLKYKSSSDSFEKIIEKSGTRYQYTTHISVSANGVFFNIDYSFGYTEVYRVIFKNLIPSKIEKICEFNLLENPYTIISGEDMTCASFTDETVILFCAVNGLAIKKIKLQSKITTIAFDEYNRNLVISTANGIQIFDYNINLHLSFELQDLITAVAVIQLQNRDEKRTVICGTESGRILLIYFDNKGVDVKPLMSKHKNRIRSITIDSEKRAFVSIDIEGNAYLWNKSAHLNFSLEIIG